MDEPWDLSLEVDDEAAARNELVTMTEALEDRLQSIRFWRALPDANPAMVQSYFLHVVGMLELFETDTENRIRTTVSRILASNGLQEASYCGWSPQTADSKPLDELVGLMEAAAAQLDESTSSRGPSDPSDDVLVADLIAAMVLAFRNAGGQLQDRQSAQELGQRLGKQAAAATAWRARVGESLETEQVTRLLGITRQALDSRKRTGSVLALTGIGTSYYPKWQFDTDGTKATVRPITLNIVAAFRERDENIDPHKIAAWAMSPQPELDGQTPAAWIEAGGDFNPVLVAAKRTAILEAS